MVLTPKLEYHAAWLLVHLSSIISVSQTRPICGCPCVLARHESIKLRNPDVYISTTFISGVADPRHLGGEGNRLGTQNHSISCIYSGTLQTVRMWAKLSFCLLKLLCYGLRLKELSLTLSPPSISFPNKVCLFQNQDLILHLRSAHNQYHQTHQNGSISTGPILCDIIPSTLYCLVLSGPIERAKN